MSYSQPVAAEGGSEFHAPGPGSFELPPIFGDVTKPMVLLVLSAVLVFGFFYAASRNASLVPGRLQFAGEIVYGFVRNTHGSRQHRQRALHEVRALPLHAVHLHPGEQLLRRDPVHPVPDLLAHRLHRPARADRAGCIYIGAGIWKHGALGYLKHATMPGGVKGPILLLLVPLEFFSNIIVRPVTLTLRLFGNMFAGHLLLILFATGGAALLASGNLLYGAVGMLSFGLGIGVSFLEMLVHVPPGLRLHPPELDVHRRGPRRRALIRTTPQVSPNSGARDASPTKGKAVEGSINMIGLGLSAIGPGVGIGLIFAAFISGVARQPEAQSRLQSIAILGFVLAEALFIITVALAFVLPL